MTAQEWRLRGRALLARAREIQQAVADLDALAAEHGGWWTFPSLAARADRLADEQDALIAALDRHRESKPEGV